MDNPFTISFGYENKNFIKREEEFNKIINEFSSTNITSSSYLILGLRGSGKTVFMSYIASYFNNEKDWIVINLGGKKNILENLTAELYEKSKSKIHFLDGEFSFSYQGFSISIKGKKPISNILVLLKEILSILKIKDKKVLITIDEVDNSEEMKDFISNYQMLIREQFSVYLLMTGLYENISKLQDDKSLTFLYRTPRITLSSLSIIQIKQKYETFLSLNEAEAIKLARFSKGYAYAYQVLGHTMFNLNKKEVDKEVLNEFDNILFEFVYEKIYSELSNKEQQILKSFNSNEAIKLKTLIDNSSLDEKTIGVYRIRLIKKGIINSPSYGMVEFTLPRFKEFLEYK